MNRYQESIQRLSARVEAEGWPSYKYKAEANDAKRRGYPAGKRLIFGPVRRFGIEPHHSRFDALSWVLYDAESENATMQQAEMISACETFEEAQRIAAGLLEIEERAT